MSKQNKIPTISRSPPEERYIVRCDLCQRLYCCRVSTTETAQLGCFSAPCEVEGGRWWALSFLWGHCLLRAPSFNVFLRQKMSVCTKTGRTKHTGKARNLISCLVPPQYTTIFTSMWHLPFFYSWGNLWTLNQIWNYKWDIFKLKYAYILYFRCYLDNFSEYFLSSNAVSFSVWIKTSLWYVGT